MTTRINIWLTAFIVLATTLLVWADNAKAQDIACMGDSITDGYGVSSGQEFCALLDGDNFGVSSVTSAYGVSILSSVLAATPDLVVIEYGLNDSYGNNVPLTRFRFNMRRIIKKLQKSNIEPLILIANPSYYTSFNATYKPYVRAMRALAFKNKTLLVDAYGAFAEVKVEGSTNLYYDDLHPNAAGHALIADLIFEVLEQ